MKLTQSIPSAVFFDLDGTLLDTAPDMVNALNYVLQSEGKAPLAYEEVRDTVSHGSAALITLGFGESNSHNISTFRHRQTCFLDYYAEHLYVDTVLFIGMEKVLESLAQQGFCWGVVTNKPEFLTLPLLKGMGLLQRACSIISGDSLPLRKPNPEPLYAAAKECGVNAEQCLYIGDAQRDIEAANNANMFSILANYGYISNSDSIHDWQAQAIIETPEEILNWLRE
jgi:phosphoglycolate phosphatase